MAKRPCARTGCPELVLSGYCEKHRQHSCAARTEAKRGSAASRGYDRRWAKASKRRLAEFPLCEGLRLEPGGPVEINTHPGRVVAAALTDHIVPHKGDMRLFWDETNWQSGCDDCHNVKTAREDGGFGRGEVFRAGGRGCKSLEALAP